MARRKAAGKPIDLRQRLPVSADSPDYVELCLTPAFPERPETRSLRAMGGLDELLTAARSGSRQIRMTAERLLAKREYAGFDIVYSWLAYSFEHDITAQLDLLQEGLDRCPRRCILLNWVACSMLDLRRGAEALYYWAQAAGNAERIGAGEQFNSYQHLAEVAGSLGDPDASAAFTRRFDSPHIQLKPNVVVTVNEVFLQQRTEPMREVVRVLAHRIAN